MLQQKHLHKPPAITFSLKQHHRSHSHLPMYSAVKFDINVAR